MPRDSAPSISVCIPVHNFFDFLGVTLESIMSQLGPSDELVVYDGGSTDRTPELMEHHRIDPRVTYFHAQNKGGIDADLASCVALASRDYCWLFSGDDLMRAGALEAVRGHLAKGSDVLVCEHSLCDKHMNFLRDYPVMLSNRPMRADWSDPAQRIEWFAAARNTEAIFSFLSGIVVKRDVWNAGRLPHGFERSCWGHVARLFELSKQKLVAEYLPHIYLDKRGGNDSFLGNSAVARIRLAIDGYDALARTYLGADSAEAKHVRRLLRREHGLAMFLFLRLSCREFPERESRTELDRMAAILHSGSMFGGGWLFAYRFSPDWLLLAARGSVRASRRLLLVLRSRNGRVRPAA